LAMEEKDDRQALLVQARKMLAAYLERLIR